MVANNTNSEPADDAVVSVANLSRQFGAKRALDNVTLSIPAGTVLGLVGENGAGKTTLIRHVLGLLRAEGGTVRPSSAIVRMIAPKMSRRTTGSSPDDGSSSTSKSGRCASATSSPARARCPRDSVPTRALESRSNASRSSSAYASFHPG